MRKAVTADHRQPMCQDTLHVLLIHLKEDATRRKEALRRLAQAHVPVISDIVQHTPGTFGVRYGPSDLHGYIGPHSLRHQDGGTRGVGVHVEVNALTACGKIYRRQCLTERPKFSGIEHLWWLITTGAFTDRPIRNVSSIEISTSLASSRMWVT